MIQITTLLCLLHTITIVVTVTSLEVKSYQSIGNVKYYPESDVETIASRPNTGISFSGGGSRAYISALGYLAGFHKLGLISNIKYIIGVSGGSWATSVYSFHQNETLSDDELLGAIISPKDIIYSDLSIMSKNCARSYTNVETIHTRAMKGIAIDKTSSTKLNDDSDDVTFAMWSEAVQTTFLDPAGITRGIPFSYDSVSVEDIKKRNPQLNETDFLVVRKESKIHGIASRPLPMMGTTLVGPTTDLPYTPTNRDYSILEITPLSVGVLQSRVHTYGSTNHTIGGLIEPYAFGGEEAPVTGMSPDVGMEIIEIPDLSQTIMDVNLATSSSSYYAGCLVAAGDKDIALNLSAIVPYFSPVVKNPVKDASKMLLADGGGLQIDNMISLLQRGVSNIILFSDTSVPLQPSSKWNPILDELSITHIDYDIPSFFGVIPIDLPSIDEVYYDLTKSQVFDSNDWIPLAISLQEAQSIGNGIIVKSILKTIKNDYYGINGNIDVNVTWVYTGRLSNWEIQLNEEMQELVIPSTNTTDLSNTISNGPFTDFPNYPTLFSDINYERANLLADISGWTILENEKLFRDILK